MISRQTFFSLGVSILTAASAFAATNDTIATVSSEKDAIAEGISEVRPPDTPSAPTAEPAARGQTSPSSCFCCPCQEAASRMDRLGKRAKLSFGTSGVEVQWSVAFWFAIMFAVLFGIIRYVIKAVRSRRKISRTALRTKTRCIFKALVESLEEAVERFPAEIELCLSDFAEQWGNCISENETIQSLFDWSNPTSPNEQFAIELPALAAKVKPLLRMARFDFENKTISDGMVSIVRLLKLYADSFSKDTVGGEGKPFTFDDIETIKDALAKGKTALSAMM